MYDCFVVSVRQERKAAQEQGEGKGVSMQNRTTEQAQSQHLRSIRNGAALKIV